MVGVSSGAWVTLVAAALDPRITLSVPVSGVMPLALLQGPETSAHEIVGGISDIAGVLDLSVMGADRHGRRQLQIFNRYDRCCFHGPRLELYAPQSAAAAKGFGGRIDVSFDETHARHKISGWARGRIMAIMPGGFDCRSGLVVGKRCLAVGRYADAWAVAGYVSRRRGWSAWGLRPGCGGVSATDRSPAAAGRTP